MNRDNAIEVVGISKVFTLRKAQKDAEGNNTNQLLALSNVSFEVKKGDSVGIIGPNGSGKSTLLKILAGVTKPTSGEVKIRGKVASILDIGAGFHPDLSGRENIFLNGQIFGFSKKEISQCYDEIVAFSGIEKFIDEPVKNYSNGMYLRLAFSIMAHLDFDVYLFDEVMSVGDLEFNLKTKAKIQELLSSEKTVLFVSHNLNELHNMNSFLRLEYGNLVDNSSQSEVLSDYYEDNLWKKHGITIQNRTVTDFSSFPKAKGIKLNKVELLQEGEDRFLTNKEIKFIVEFEKQSNQDEALDLIILISDLQGSIILSTNPLLSGFSSNIENGFYKYTCIFPPSIFGFQVYNIGLLFTKNTLDKFRGSKNSLSISKGNISNAVSSSYRIDNIISFKPQFKISELDIAESNKNIGGGLLPIFNWELNFEKK